MPDLATRVVSALPAGASFSRYLRALTQSRGDLRTARDIALAWKDSPQVAAAFDVSLGTKAAVGAGTTTDATWAKPLVTSGIAREAISVLRGISILGALEPRLRRIDFNLKVPVDASAVTLGGWVQEAAPIPVAALAFNTAGPLDPTKAAVIVALSRELLTFGTPGSDALVRQSVLNALAAFVDQQFLLPTVAAVAGVNPASITNGATEVVSTGASAAQMSADLASMVAAITTSGGNLVWVMKPTTMARIAGALGSTAGLPQNLYGLPVVASKNSPAQVTLLDGDAVLLATDDNGFDVSMNATSAVQMNSAPDSPATAATVMTSFFQQNLIGVRAIRMINWLRSVNGSVVFMTVSY